MIHTEDAFEYQTFPTNPLGTRIENVQTDLQRLWGGTEFQLFTGLEVEKWVLDPMNAQLAGTGAPCFNNKRQTWFAG